MQAQKNGHTILIGEDELEVREYFEMALKCLGYSVEFAQDGEEVISQLKSLGSSISAVLLDLMMPRRDGMEALREIRKMYPELPVIMVSGEGSPINIVKAMKTGATDFICKPVTHDDLRKTIHSALDSHLPALPRGGQAPVPRQNVFVGSNGQMREIYNVLASVGWSEVPVLIQGETGSGKEVLARDLHNNSPRAGKIFLKLNCAALPSELVESELFGYERGAFTGAFQKKAGMFETANGGTIFLDEIGDMDVRLQAKLLQVLQDKEFQRIGGKETIRVDVRVMAATHRDLEKAIAERTFREDLYYRLNVINLHLPPLRDRREDIVPMAEYLLKRHSPPGRPVSLTVDLRNAMMRYRWPGNVRELENQMRKLIVYKNPDMVARELNSKSGHSAQTHSTQTHAAPIPVSSSLHAVADPEPIRMPAAEPESVPLLERVNRAKHQAEADVILNALNATRWNRKQAASMLKIDYKALLYKMKKLGLDDASIEAARFDAAPEQAFSAAGS
jgi:two-component system response regulator AtoC